jgi:assimilatory nitrate reductase catalytic subunit
MSALGTEIRTLFSLAFNFTVSSPDAISVIERVSHLDFFCVADFFLSETARLADVVLPSTQWAEEDGTMTNLEGRVLRRRRAFMPPAEVRTDIEILCDLAARLGVGRHFSYANAQEVFDEVRAATRGGVADYSGITYSRLEAGEAIHWPCPEENHPGTPRLFTESFGTPKGKARFHAIRHRSSVEEPDAEYPLYLTTGRVLAHYQSGTQTRRVGKLMEMAAEPFAEFHPRAAQRYGLVNGGDVTLVTRRGIASFRVRVTAGIREDTVFVPFHWGDGHSANRLTNPGLDPVSRMPEFKVCAVRVETFQRP